MTYRKIIPVLCVACLALWISGCRPDITTNGDGKETTGSMQITDTADLKFRLNEFADNPDDVELAKSIMDFYAIMDRYEELLVFARSFFEENISEDSRKASLAAMYIAYPYILTSEKDSAAKYLDYCEAYMDDYPEYAIMYNNTLSQYKIKFEMNHTEAMRRLKIALDYAVSENATEDRIIVLGNIASMYFLRYDTAGISYAREAYRLASNVDNVYSKSFAAYTLGVVESINGYGDNVIQHIMESVALVKQCNYLNSTLTKNYASLASIYLLRGDIAKAQEAYTMAFNYMDCISDVNVRAQLYASYAGFKMYAGNNIEARKYYQKALELCDEYKYIDNKFNIYYGLSELYSRMNVMDSAYYYHKKYAYDYRNTFSLQKEKELNNLLMEYDKIQYENELQRQEIKLANSRKTIFFILMILAIALGGFLSIYLVYRKKDTMYLQLVAKHQQLLRNQELTKLQEKNHEGTKDEQEMSGIALFKKLENMMTNDKIFKDPDISLSKLAELLGSNRTYVSAIINKYSSKSFYNYIHSYRISEAVSIISDVNADIVLKAVSSEVGYKSISCFYRAFCRETGCTPVIYREKVIQLQKQGEQAELPIDL